jgi:predicted ATPase/DNA-binding SARP family transcriptional activator
MDTPATACRIDLLGGLTVRRGSLVLTRFEVRRAATLLARLAFYPRRVHPREELMEMLWPEEDLEVTMPRFRQVLTSLRHSLASLDANAAHLLIADRTEVRLNGEAVRVDVAEFEAALLAASRANSANERVTKLQEAVELYTGDLLPGYYDDWVLTERQRLARHYVGALGHLATALAEAGDAEGAIRCSQRAVAADPLSEESHCSLMHLYASLGQPSKALRQYRDMEQTLWKELRALPSDAARSLRAAIESAPLTPVAIIGTDAPAIPASPPASEPPFLPNPLPAPLTRFFGREEETSTIVGMLWPETTESPLGAASFARLITLTGPGGSGKTRLALEVARRLRIHLPDCVWFVPLAAVTAADRTVEAIANVVCPLYTPISDSLKQVTEAIGPRPALLVLDNFEQLAEDGGQVVRSLLERLPEVRCIVTSRRGLNVEGEQEHAVQPLETPTAVGELDRLQEFPAVALFLDRARLARPDFRLTTANAASVASLCRRLEGIPLALELAAGWIAVLSPAQILERLSGRLDLLATSRKDVDDRHHSLWATLDWSCQQLAPELKQFFTYMCVFQDGCTLEAAEAICEGGGPHTTRVQSTQAFEHLSQLRQHSLVQAVDNGEGVRFRMLETLREFAQAQLSPEDLRALCSRHATFYLSLAEKAELHLVGPDQVVWMDRLEADHDNIRAALARFEGPEGDVESGLRFAASLWRFWEARGHFAEARRWLGSLLENADRAGPSAHIAPTTRAHALLAAGSVGGLRSEFGSSNALLMKALSLFRELGDVHNTAITLCSLASNVRDSGDDAGARPLFEEALSLSQKHGDTLAAARAFGGLGTITWADDDHETVYSLLEKSAAMYRLCGHKKGMAWSVHTRGAMAYRQRDYVLALSYFQDALPLFRDLGDTMWSLYTLSDLGDMNRLIGNVDFARRYWVEGHEVSKGLGVRQLEVVFSLLLGDLDATQHAHPAAWARYREALTVSSYADLSAGLSATFLRMACLAATEGQNERAVCLFRCATAQGEPTEWARFLLPPIPNQTEPDMLRAGMDADAYSKAWKRGEGMSREQAVAYALAD